MKSLTRHFAILPMVCALACGGEEKLINDVTASVVLGADERATDLSDIMVLHASNEEGQEDGDGWVKLWAPYRFQMTFRSQLGKQDCKPTAEYGTTLSSAIVYKSAATGDCGMGNAIRCEIDVQAIPGNDGGFLRGTFSALLECSEDKPALELKNGTFEVPCSDRECFKPLRWAE